MPEQRTSRREVNGARHIVLVGCSFAGLEFLYRYVRRRRSLSAGELTVIDPRTHHPYIPLAHEAVSGTSKPADLLFPTAAFCESLGIRFVKATAVGIDALGHLVHLNDGASVPYDRLIIAVGSEPAIPSTLAHRDVIGAKWLDDAISLRHRILTIHETSWSAARLTIIGTGITGVEWAAETAANEFGGYRPLVTLVGREDRLLATFSPGIAAHAANVLRALGVRCILARSVTATSSDSVILDGGERIPSDVIIWAGGVRPNRSAKNLQLPLTPDSHIIVTPRLAVSDRDDVYAIGDAVRVVEDGVPWPTMVRAIEAIWQGALLARRMTASWGDDEGPRHRLRRDFFYGLLAWSPA